MSNKPEITNLMLHLVANFVQRTRTELARHGSHDNSMAGMRQCVCGRYIVWLLGGRVKRLRYFGFGDLGYAYEAFVIDGATSLPPRQCKFACTSSD